MWLSWVASGLIIVNVRFVAMGGMVRVEMKCRSLRPQK